MLGWHSYLVVMESFGTVSSRIALLISSVSFLSVLWQSNITDYFYHSWMKDE